MTEQNNCLVNYCMQYGEQLFEYMSKLLIFFML